MVIAGLKSINERKQEAQKLLDWGFRQFQPIDVYAKGDRVGAARVWGGTGQHGRFAGLAKCARGAVGRRSRKLPKLKLAYTGPLMAPVEAGDEGRQRALPGRRLAGGRSAGRNRGSRGRRSIDVVTRPRQHLHHDLRQLGCPAFHHLRRRRRLRQVHPDQAARRTAASRGPRRACMTREPGGTPEAEAVRDAAGFRRCRALDGKGRSPSELRSTRLASRTRHSAGTGNAAHCPMRPLHGFDPRLSGRRRRLRPRLPRRPRSCDCRLDAARSDA